MKKKQDKLGCVILKIHNHNNNIYYNYNVRIYIYNHYPSNHYNSVTREYTITVIEIGVPSIFLQLPDYCCSKD